MSFVLAVSSAHVYSGALFSSTSKASLVTVPNGSIIYSYLNYFGVLVGKHSDRRSFFCLLKNRESTFCFTLKSRCFLNNFALYQRLFCLMLNIIYHTLKMYCTLCTLFAYVSVKEQSLVCVNCVSTRMRRSSTSQLIRSHFVHCTHFCSQVLCVFS